ncbi:WhiB family transcriptional regulator [Streptomyces sp. NPDC088733]|uniref:WhiB family transcriptional regulator n=1 Tax=Streptomyces sp. NPDC088733 TaxID=3365880 RepID=UPI003804ABBC
MITGAERTAGVGSQNWGRHAACRTGDADALFVQGAEPQRAKALCTDCTVRTECRAYALDHRIEDGVRGGMTEPERRALLRRRPAVVSWRALLEAARQDHLQTCARPRSGYALRETG